MCPASSPQTGARDPPVCPASSPQTGARDHPCAQHPRRRQGPGTTHVPSILASDRGSGPSVCPASSPQTGAKDPSGAQHPRLRQGLGITRVPSIVCPRQGLRTPVCPASCAPDRGQGTPCAQHHVPQTDVSKSFSVQQCAHKGGRVCLQVSPQEPETTRAKTHDLLLAEPPGGGGNRVEAARSGGRNSRNSRKNGRLEKQKVPRCVQGQALQPGGVDQLVVRILLATVSGLGVPSRECQHKVHQGQV